MVQICLKKYVSKVFEMFKCEEKEKENATKDTLKN